MSARAFRITPFPFADYFPVQRTLKPEILDSLAPDDPAARHNRRDLRIINGLMGNLHWFQRVLPSLTQPGDRLLEIGAGTGELQAVLSPRFPQLEALDLWPAPPGWSHPARWHQGDLGTFDRWRDYEVILGNMIFHQFDAPTLRALGTRIAAHARIVVACEPARHRIWQGLFAALCPLIGANHVSRHDGHVSIAAGFVGDELPDLLGLDPRMWEWQVATSCLGAYRLIARKRT